MSENLYIDGYYSRYTGDVSPSVYISPGISLESTLPISDAAIKQIRDSITPNSIDGSFTCPHCGKRVGMLEVHECFHKVM